MHPHVQSVGPDDSPREVGAFTDPAVLALARLVCIEHRDARVWEAERECQGRIAKGVANAKDIESPASAKDRQLCQPYEQFDIACGNPAACSKAGGRARDKLLQDACIVLVTSIVGIIIRAHVCVCQRGQNSIQSWF